MSPESRRATPLEAGLWSEYRRRPLAAFKLIRSWPSSGSRECRECRSAPVLLTESGNQLRVGPRSAYCVEVARRSPISAHATLGMLRGKGCQRAKFTRNTIGDSRSRARPRMAVSRGPHQAREQDKARFKSRREHTHMGLLPTGAHGPPVPTPGVTGSSFVPGRGAW